jgi:tetratricopeptide (TPR) repeat protein
VADHAEFRKSVGSRDFPATSKALVRIVLVEGRVESRFATRERHQELSTMNPNALVQARWDRLRTAYKADLPALTVARAREFVAEHSDCGPVWKMLGAALVELSRYQEGEEALRQAIALCPSDKLWIPLAELGHMHKARGDYRAAAHWYRKAIDAEPDEAGPHIHLGGVLARSGRLHEAEAAHRAATLCEQGCRDEAFLNLGLVLRALERHDEAARCFEAALQIDPKYCAAKKALRDVRRTLKLFRGDHRRRFRPKPHAVTEHGGLREPEAAVA